MIESEYQSWIWMRSPSVPNLIWIHSTLIQYNMFSDCTGFKKQLTFSLSLLFSHSCEVLALVNTLHFFWNFLKSFFFWKHRRQTNLSQTNVRNQLSHHIGTESTESRATWQEISWFMLWKYVYSVRVPIVFLMIYSNNLI